MEYYKSHLNLNQFSNDPDKYKTGLLECNDDVYFVNNVIVENNRAIHGDSVIVDENNKIVSIKSRSNKLIVGILHLNGNTKYGYTKKNVPYYKFTPISNKFPPFIVPSKDKSKSASYCVIKINKWETKNKNPIGMVEYFIGKVGSIENEINMLLYKSEIYPKKNKITYNKLDSLDDIIVDYNTFSIDPPDCKDIDDALHFEKHNEYYIVGVHIANVARYIENYNTNYYSSIYLENKQLNMLDEKHSFTNCSLGNGEKKRALSLILKFKGCVIEDYHFKETKVKNSALSYQDAESIISKTESGSLYELWRFTCKIKNNNELTATSMVEYYMLLYNNLLATTLYKKNVNTILRTHKSVNITETHNLIPRESDKLSLFLKRINQNAAKYEINPENTKHEDLNLDYYTHGTSPIRRYVDIINQKNMINLLEDNELVCAPEDEIDTINLFQKNLRKFYNYYKKLQVIFKIENSNIYNAFVVGINKYYINIYIPDIEITHSFRIISPKLLNANSCESSINSITVNNTEIKLYQQIKIKLTPLKYEENFNRKINIELLDPVIELV
jgi:exoribonuclease R